MKESQTVINRLRNMSEDLWDAIKNALLMSTQYENDKEEPPEEFICVLTYLMMQIPESHSAEIYSNIQRLMEMETFTTNTYSCLFGAMVQRVAALTAQRKSGTGTSAPSSDAAPRVKKP